MSITFYANIDIDNYKKKKMFVEESYSLDSFENSEYFENDPFLNKDLETGRFYEMVPDIDFEFEVNMSNDNFFSVIKNIDNDLYFKILEGDWHGSFEKKELSAFRSKIIKALNTSGTNGVRDKKVEGNFHYNGVDKDYINSKLKTMLTIIENAQNLNIGVCWS